MGGVWCGSDGGSHELRELGGVLSGRRARGVGVHGAQNAQRPRRAGQIDARRLGVGGRRRVPHD